MTGAQTDLLNGLSEEDAARFLALGTPTSLASGQTLFRLGADADKAYLVRRGRIALTLPLQIRGREEEVLVEETLPGETVGWSGFVPPHRFTLNAAAAIDSELLGFPRASVLEPLRGASRRGPHGDPEPGGGDRPPAPGVPDDVAARDAARGGAPLPVREKVDP